MYRLFFIIIISFCLNISTAQKDVHYLLTHSANSNKIEITIEFDRRLANSVKLVIPRSGPGTYDLTNYLAFIENLKGYTDSGEVLNGAVGDGSFFNFHHETHYLNKISYEVDLLKMESQLLGGFASSKLRDNYLGILGYSVFGFVEGLEDKSINLEIKTEKDWPIFSTLRPSSLKKLESDNYKIENFAQLADAQFLLGNGVQVFEVKQAQIPLFVAVYTETPIDIKEIGRRGLMALEGLADYFGYVPMPHYSLCYEFLIPHSDRHEYGFSMEHLNSMTASLDTSRAISNYNPRARIGSIVHHMGHSWLPLRSYGTGYRPFEWQTAPIIETIWLNEGFIWYISFYNILNQERILDFFKETLVKAPNYIQEKSLVELSRLGSTQYSLDFRIGKNLFSRGALFAHELDVFIQKETNGQRSFKDAILGLLNWTNHNQRAYEYDEIEMIMSGATGVNLSDIWNRWQLPMKK